MKTYLLFASILFYNILFSQQCYTYNTGGYTGMNPCADGGLVHMCTYATSLNRPYIFKTDSNRNMVWSEYVPVGISRAEEVVETADRGIVAVGENLTQDTIFIFKLTENGSLLWCKSLSGGASSIFNDLVPTADSGFIFSGGACSVGPNLILKMDKDGIIQWAKSYFPTTGGNVMGGNAIVTDNDNHPVIAGIYGIGEDSTWNIILFKVNHLNGTLMWFRIYDIGSRDYAHSLIKTRDGGFTIAGQTAHLSDFEDKGFLLHTDSIGNLLWTRVFYSSKKSYLMETVETENGDNLSVGNVVYSDSRNVEALAIRTDMNGNVIWQKSTGNAAYNHYGYDFLSHARYLGNNRFLLCGSTDAEVFFEMNDSIGFCEVTNEDLISTSVQAVQTNPVILTNPIIPFVEKQLISSDVKVTFTKQLLCTTTGISDEHETPTVFESGPNPFTGDLNIRIEQPFNRCSVTLFDVLGNKVTEQKIETQSSALPLVFLPAGVYVLEVTIDGQREVRRVVKE